MPEPGVRRAAAFALAAALVLAGCRQAQPGKAGGWQAEPVTLDTADGWRIAGEFRRRPGAASGWAFLLLHQYRGSRSDWEPLLEVLAGTGAAVLSIDLRGHGRSVVVGGARRTVSSFNPGADFRAMRKDAEAAVAFLAGRGFPRRRVVLVGAGLGAGIALACAAAEKEIPAVVLLSPLAVEKGVNAAEAASRYGPRPVLLIVAREDHYARRSALELARRMSGGTARIITLPGKARGRRLLAEHAGEAAEAVRRFLAECLPASE